MSDTTDPANAKEFTPEEYQQLANSPADSAIVFEGGEEPPEGVVSDE